MDKHVTFRVDCHTGRGPQRKGGGPGIDRPQETGRVAFALGPGALACLKRLAQELGVSEFQLIAAGLRALELRYQGRLGEAPSSSFRRLAADETLPEYRETSGTLDVSADYPLTLALQIRDDEKWVGSWRYQRDLFDSEAIVQLDRHYCRLLAALVKEPDVPISVPCFLSETEWNRAVHVWNETRTSYPRESSIPELFGEVVERHGDAIALIDGPERLTYHELDERSSRLAALLVESGLAPGDRVGIALERSAAMVVSMLAVVKAGCAYVPLDATYPDERVRFMVCDTNLAVILTDQVRSRVMPGDVTTICIDKLSAETGSVPDVSARSNAGSSAYIMYTSGSTGTPKGVEVPHRAIIRLVRDATYVDFGPDEVFAQISNASFDAITFEVWGALLNGGRLVILPTDVILSPDAFANAVQQYRLSAMFVTASLFNFIAARCPAAFHTVRHLIVGGDAVDPRWARHVLKTAPPRRMINGYGPTETTTFAVTHEIREVEQDATTVPIGRPLSNSQAYVLDWNMQPVPVGVAGELYLGGDGLAKGYWNRPEITAERFVPSPFDPTGRLYKTGDLARYLANGVIECLGRTDHQVKIRGFRIEMGEIETCLRRHPDVEDCVVIASQDASGAKNLVAYVANGTRTAMNQDEAQQYLRESLPEFMIPSAFHFLTHLPLSPNGKVDRAKLPTALRPENGSARHANEPVTREQQMIARAWYKVLGGNGFGIDDNFFDIGGNSLLMAAVECELRPQTAALFTITDLFEFPTIRSLAERLSNSVSKNSFLSEAQERVARRKAAVSGLSRIARSTSVGR